MSGRNGEYAWGREILPGATYPPFGPEVLTPCRGVRWIGGGPDGIGRKPSSSAETIPLMAAAPSTPKVLPRELCPIVLAGIQFDDFYHFGLLLKDDCFAFRKSNPYEGDRHEK